MLKKVVILGSISGFAMLLSGCATILDGKTQTINLTTSKPKSVDINGQQYSAPGIITLQKENKDAVLNIKECNKTIVLTKSVTPSFFVNILSGGALGSTTDYATDAMWKYDQTNVNVDCN
ncbi:MAG: adenosine deaminase [Campylobacterales bacterium]|nr:adenosine deaminase [Campylobacterales bacterium]